MAHRSKKTPREKPTTIKEKAGQLAEAARLRYIDGFRIEDIKDELNLRDFAAAANLVKMARSSSVVFFDIDECFGYSGRPVKHLADRIAQRFRQISIANVVKIEAETNNEYDQDNYLHTVLANMAALNIAGRIKPGIHIAVGGGRAVYQASRHIRRCVRPHEDVQITPLCGRIWTHSWQNPQPPRENRFPFKPSTALNEAVIGNLRQPLDADDSAFVLFSAFEREHGTRFSQVMYPLFAKDKSEAERHMSDHCPFLPHGEWRRGEKPDMAIVGVGQVHPQGGHRFADIFRDPTTAREDTYLTQVAAELERARKTVEDHRLSYFGDVTNRLYPSLPLPQLIPESLELEDPKLAEGYRTLFTQLAQLNSRMVVIDWDHLRSIKEVTVIAGGKFKREALWTLLFSDLAAFCVSPAKDKKGLVYELWTDSETAEWLIKAYDSLTDELWDWYQSMSAELFTSVRTRASGGGLSHVL